MTITIVTCTAFLIAFVLGSIFTAWTLTRKYNLVEVIPGAKYRLPGLESEIQVALVEGFPDYEVIYYTCGSYNDFKRYQLSIRQFRRLATLKDIE